jgi:hypothetical protein
MPNDKPDFKNDWTIMFFFASDNPLAPLLVSQLKAIKDAGFQEHTEVLVYFDPMEKGRETKIYNVNSKRKAYARDRSRGSSDYPQSLIGDGNDSYIRKMDGDEVDSESFSPEMKEAMSGASQASAHEMLGHFIDYGIKNHSAPNYMLFLVGHGMIVGRDMFLPDEDPISAITLQQLQQITKKFTHEGETSLQLLALHSCSMSSIEVAYQLRGTANYLMAHQGVAFANSWPYRQLVKKILNTIEKEKPWVPAAEGQNPEELEKAIKEKGSKVNRLVEKLYFHCLHNATDFLSAGYSADLALVSLKADKLSGIREPLQNLVRKLKEHLSKKTPLVNLILLAHWESQSFWDENYTDLYDFCFCLRRKCNEMESMLTAVKVKEGEIVDALDKLGIACDDLIKVLSRIKARKRSKRFERLVIQADNFGTKYQYARGLSVYFPWCEPLDDDKPVPVGKCEEAKTTARNQKIINHYKSYDFNVDFGDDSWWSFLDLYFTNTKRRPAKMNLKRMVRMK